MTDSVTGRPEILIVDDESINLDILMETLYQDYEISLAMDGKSALATAAAVSPDLILLDIIMPGMDGYEVCRRLKADPATAEIPVIFVTAMEGEADETLGFELGAVDYITKPISQPVVKARVRVHMELLQARKRLIRHNETLAAHARLQAEVDRMTRHDLRTPLSAIISVPDLLAMDGNLTPDQVRLLDMLKNAGFRMMAMVNSSINLFRMEQGRYTVTPEPVDLLKTAGQIKNELRGHLSAKGVALDIRVRGSRYGPGQDFVVQGEEILFYSLLANLIQNAVEASPDGGTVSLAMDDGEKTLITIHNKGKVPHQIHDRFFEKYATFGKVRGTGLGTYMARLIVKTMGGKIDMVSSQAEGTRIRVIFS